VSLQPLLVFDFDGVILDGMDEYWSSSRAACRSLLQGALLPEHTPNSVRRQAVSGDRAGWVALHRPFKGVQERLAGLEEEGVAWSVLTTKGRDFTDELLDAFQLRPVRLDGRESGPKPEVLLRLRREWALKGFVEDRRATLEVVLETPGLEGLKCFLADWGYLRPADREGLPEGLDLLSTSKFAAPLAIWP